MIGLHQSVSTPWLHLNKEKSLCCHLKSCKKLIIIINASDPVVFHKFYFTWGLFRSSGLESESDIALEGLHCFVQVYSHQAKAKAKTMSLSRLLMNRSKRRSLFAFAQSEYSFTGKLGCNSRPRDNRCCRFLVDCRRCIGTICIDSKVLTPRSLEKSTNTNKAVILH